MIDETKDAEETQGIKRPWTPGAWVMGDETNSHAQVCLGESNCSVDLRRFADYPHCPEMSRNEMLANAHLIECAPELFEALERLIGYVDSPCGGCGENNAPPEVIAQAEAALAKAIGGQP